MKQNRNKKGEVITKLYFCDNKENDMIQSSTTGGRTLVRTHYFGSEVKHKNSMILKII